MGRVQKIDISDNDGDTHTWGVATVVIGRASVVIPVDQLGNMSDEEIGQTVRELLPHAVNLLAVELIDDLGKSYVKGAPVSWLHELADLIEIGPQSSPQAHELDSVVRGEIERRERPPKAKKKVPGFVYLAYAETGHHKIGISKYPEKRIKMFNTKMPVAVQLVHVFPSDDMRKSEQDLHKLYAHKRHDGEWFNLDGWDIEYVMEISHYESGEFVCQSFPEETS